MTPARTRGRAPDAEHSKRADARRRGGASSPTADRRRPALQLVAEAPALLDHFISTGEERQGQGKAELFRGLQVDD